MTHRGRGTLKNVAAVLRCPDLTLANNQPGVTPFASSAVACQMHISLLKAILVVLALRLLLLCATWGAVVNETENGFRKQDARYGYISAPRTEDVEGQRALRKGH